MKAATKSKPAASGDEIAAYSRAQSPANRDICDMLHGLIAAVIPKATSKVWHGGPVWFNGENPVVGYDASAKGVKLLFWNGQAFEEPDLSPVGKYGAAGITFATVDDIDDKAVRRWLKKAKENVFDSVGFFKKMREKQKATKASK